MSRRFFLLAALLLCSACATLPKTVSIGEGEARHVRQQFMTMLEEQRQCPAAIDADVSLSIDNALWRGTLSGSLRAQAPASLRFEGVNPLGLTEALLAVDGESFTYLSVRQQEAYLGSFQGEKITRFVPDGVALSMNYYWLLGRVPPGELGLGDIGQQPEGQGYWVDIHYLSTDERAMILFDPRQHQVNRHLLLTGHGDIAVDFTYTYPSLSMPTEGCQLPSQLTISKRGNGLITLSYTNRYPKPPLDAAPFRLTPPPDYKRIVLP